MRHHLFNRRRFLAVGAALAVAGPAACARRPEDDLDTFIRLSALLTGFKANELDPQLARTYHDAVQDAMPKGLALEDLYLQTGFRSAAPPQTFEQLERGVFDYEPSRLILDEIATCWYSGTVPAPGPLKLRVATYDAALAWKAITWTTPNMVCRGQLGFWSEPPGTGTA